MITAVLFGLALLQTPKQQKQHIYPGNPELDVRGMLQDKTGFYWIHGKAMDEAQLSPQKFGTPPAPWEFFYHTDAYIFDPTDPSGGTSGHLRFRVFSQNPVRNSTLGKEVAFELLVLWRMDFERLKLDHRDDVNEKIVDVYLCEHGDPGGEQLFEFADSKTGPKKVNSIYIYDVAHFDDHMEQAREVAHEYGHAALPAIGGFKSGNGAEYWVNGNLGEKLFLRWARDKMGENGLQPEGLMYTLPARVDYWVKQHVDPLVKAAAVRAPGDPVLKRTDRAGFDAFQGLALWCDSIMPPKLFIRSLRLTDPTHPSDLVENAVVAAEEATYSPTFPPYVANKFVWIPVGDGKVTGAKVLGKKQGWCLVQPQFVNSKLVPITVHAKMESG